MMKRAMLIASVFIVLQSNPLYGYDDQLTHPEITRKAVSDVSNLNAYLKTSLGFSNGVDAHLPSDAADANRTILKLLTSGSTDEDDPKCRASNHFHNPRLLWSQSYMTDAPWWVDRWCHNVSPVWTQYSDIVWATGYETYDGAVITRTRQTMGWDDARKYFYAALTSASKKDRETHFAQTFQAVGQVMHLLQDMAVPAHVSARSRVK